MDRCTPQDGNMAGLASARGAAQQLRVRVWMEDGGRVTESTSVRIKEALRYIEQFKADMPKEIEKAEADRISRAAEVSQPALEKQIPTHSAEMQSQVAQGWH